MLLLDLDHPPLPNEYYGLSLLELLRSDSKYRNVAIFGLPQSIWRTICCANLNGITVASETYDEKKMVYNIDAGATDYILKPVAVDVLRTLWLVSDHCNKWLYPAILMLFVASI